MIGAEQASHLSSLVVMVYVKSSPACRFLATDVAATILGIEHVFVFFNADTITTDAGYALLFVSFISVSRHTSPTLHAVPLVR